MKKILSAAIALLAGVVLVHADTTTPRLGLTVPSVGSSGYAPKINSDLSLIDTKTGCLTCANIWSATNTFSGFPPQIYPGVQSSTLAWAGGTLTVNVSTTIGNIDMGEDNLFSALISSSVLGYTGDQIVFSAAGTLANTTDDKQLRIYFGSTKVLDTGLIPSDSTGSWTAEGRCVRAAASSSRCWAFAVYQDTTTSASYSGYAVSDATLSGNVQLLFTGEATTTNDITQEGLVVEWKPGTH